jgi:aspartyl-tRNA(Asn)/glutamyl-tRNA(Gln) amidotransferase subunit A
VSVNLARIQVAKMARRDQSTTGALSNNEGIQKLSEDEMSGKISMEEIVSGELQNIRKYNKTLNAFITIFDERSSPVKSQLRFLRNARKNNPKKNNSLSLFGVPFTIKDNVYFAGFRTTAGSGVFQNFVPNVNAEIVDLFQSQGAIPLGKTNLHELAMGATSTSSFSGPVRNPVDSSRISGGSSGGSAVSVARAAHPLVSIGSDTGGSVRIPAALCGVCGFKPTISTLSTAGVFPLSATLDHVGLLTKTVPDMIRAFKALTTKNGINNSAALSLRRDDAQKDERSGNRKLRIGIPNSYFFEDSEKAVDKAFWAAIDKLRKADEFEVVEGIVVPDYDRISRIRRSIHVKEASWFYEELTQKPELRAIVHKDVMTFFDAGLKVGMAEYMMAWTERLSYIGKMSQLFRSIDYLAMPTCLCVAPKLDEIEGKEAGSIRRQLVRNTEPFNLGGFPALALPATKMSSTLPASIQIAGGFYTDLALLEACEIIWNNIQGTHT